MTVLDIVQYPEKSLSKKSSPVETIDDELKAIINDMGETMFQAPGVGLAAPQVGINRRFIVYNPSADDPDADEDKKEFRALINPEIITGSGSIISENKKIIIIGTVNGCSVNRSLINQ